MSLTNSPDISNLTSTQKRELLAKLMERQQKATTAPLSFAQQRLWFIDQLQQNQTTYTIPAALRLRGGLKIDVLQRCLNEIVARHEILRTRFVATAGEPVQKVSPSQEIALSVIDVRADNDLIDEKAVMGKVQPHLQALVAQPFDLAAGPLLRSQLFQLHEQDHILAITIHHIIADYWSLKVLMKEKA